MVRAVANRDTRHYALPYRKADPRYSIAKHETPSVERLSVEHCGPELARITMEGVVEDMQANRVFPLSLVVLAGLRI
jgi:hypothetical protein